MPRNETVKAIADYFGVSVAYLLGEEEEDRPAAPARPRNIRYLPRMKKVPRLGTIPCGAPVLAEESWDGYEEVDEDLACDFCLTCQGDSMIGARIMDGDTVFIRSQEEVENGQIAAVLIGDEATLKRVFYYPDQGILILRPDNPRYEDMIYTKATLNTIHILGRAVFFHSKVQ